ncbi:hypothetical protein GDO78_009132 [Eleutherodactylus coqui]|uniref:Aminoacyl-transfer RNA synthetases class-II family profile domain-containing protein n=1 Tax=Eleutherodactylus coqui TaxID=57060 RepID=A0A8J6KBW1_ELECQ|nr:hypothetical protein GDO78_009132 [Eleutherodactylus coqui]
MGWEDTLSTNLILSRRDASRLKERMNAVPLESVLLVKGTVIPRPSGQENSKMATGAVEVQAKDVQILNTCRKLPFEIKDSVKKSESLRMQYRYLDIRRFVDVETPTLFKRTPGGAKEFLVPTQEPGKFYSLPQSPQQFKQLLMVGGLDRYFQVARCYRDEGSRPDRQPEFTQIDIEMSFVDQLGIQRLVEGLLRYSWPEEKGALPDSFPIMTYAEAMSSYGVDKPDTRFQMKVRHLSYSYRHLSPGLCHHGAALLGHGAKYLKGKALDSTLQTIRDQYKQDVMAVTVRSDGSWKSSLGRNLTEELQKVLAGVTRAKAEDLLLLAAGPLNTAVSAALRCCMQ